jgi:hypothetical protein
MAGRILNRRELRQQNEEAERLETATPAAAAPMTKTKAKAKGAAPRAKKPRKSKAPPRLRARWGIFDSSMKQVAIFDYNQREAADAKLADLLATKKGTHFLQMVKELLAEPEPELVEAPA